MTEVRLEGIAHDFGGVPSLRGVDLVVRRREFFTLLGPSGCGKSTLLGVVAGLEAPKRGRVLFDGVDVTALSPRARDVAVVFPSGAPYPHWSVFENLAFPLKMARVSPEEIRRRVEETADRLRLREILPRRPREISDGETLRVALGRAIVRRPKLVLLDDPLSKLDAQPRLEIRALLKRLHEELRTTFLSATRDPTEAMALSERVAVLREGAILQVGAPAEIYRLPADTFVASSTGCLPMNLLPARLDAREGTLLVGDARFFWSEPLPPGAPREVLLGIRPEHVSLGLEQEAGGIGGSVSLVDPLGAETLVHVAAAAGTVVARVGPHEPFRAGDRVSLSFDPANAVLFDPRTRRRLGGPEIRVATPPARR